MKKIVFFLGCVFCFTSTYAFERSGSVQDSSKVISRIIDEIKKNNTVEDQFVGIDNQESEQYKRYQLLQRVATKKQLTDILQLDSNAVVKIYTYIALLRKTGIVDEKIHTRLLNDYSALTFQSGCIATEMTVSSFVRAYEKMGDKMVH